MKKKKKNFGALRLKACSDCATLRLRLLKPLTTKNCFHEFPTFSATPATEQQSNNKPVSIKRRKNFQWPPNFVPLPPCRHATPLPLLWGQMHSLAFMCEKHFISTFPIFLFRFSLALSLALSLVAVAFFFLPRPLSKAKISIIATCGKEGG